MKENSPWVRHISSATSAAVIAIAAAMSHLWVDKEAAARPQWFIFAGIFLVLFVLSFLMIQISGTVENVRRDAATTADAAHAQTLTAIASSSNDLLKAIGDLRAIAPRLNYYTVYGALGRAVLYEEAKKVIANAKRELFLLNWASAEEAFHDDRVEKSRDEYFKLLEERCEHLVYSRIIQSRSFWQGTGALTIADTFEDSYVEHFTSMLAKQEAQRRRGLHNISLYVVAPSIPSTFVIADDDYLIWQLNDVRDPNPTAMHWQIRGAIVIHDPGGGVIREFRATFERAKGTKYRALDRSDLIRTATADESGSS